MTACDLTNRLLKNFHVTSHICRYRIVSIDAYYKGACSTGTVIKLNLSCAVRKGKKCNQCNCC